MMTHQSDVYVSEASITEALSKNKSFVFVLDKPHKVF
jgi:hypothetical protein